MRLQLVCGWCNIASLIKGVLKSRSEPIFKKVEAIDKALFLLFQLKYLNLQQWINGIPIIKRITTTLIFYLCQRSWKISFSNNSGTVLLISNFQNVYFSWIISNLFPDNGLEFRQCASSRFALAKEIFEQEANKGYIFCWPLKNIWRFSF